MRNKPSWLPSWVNRFTAGISAAFIGGNIFFATVNDFLDAKEGLVDSPQKIAKENEQKANKHLVTFMDILGGKKGTPFLCTREDMKDRPPTGAEKEKFELARRELSDAENIAPNYYKVHQQKALYFLMIGNTGEAKLSAEKSVRLEEDYSKTDLVKKKDGRPVRDGRPLSFLGASYEKEGLISKAEAYYHASVELDPTNPFVHYNQSLFFKNRNMLHQAETVMLKAESIAMTQGITLPHQEKNLPEQCVKTKNV